MFRLVGRLGERELFVVAGLFAVIASAALMHTLHLSTALGAFVAGVMLAESPYRHELESDVEPFRSILLGLFFLSVGMLLDFNAVAARPVLRRSGSRSAIIVVKAVLIAGLALMFGMKKGRAIWLGLLLSQAGEFGFVLFGQAAAAQLITAEAASLFSAIVTLIDGLDAVPDAGHRVGPAPDAGAAGRPRRAEFSPETNAIVVGYGRFGQTVAQMLMAKRIPVTLIDSKPSQIELSEEFGTKVYYGDGTRVDLLRTAGAETRRGHPLLPEPEGADPRQAGGGVGEPSRTPRSWSGVFDRLQVIEFDGLDLAFCQRELFESAVVMGREALIKLGVARREAERVEREYRERDFERLEAQTVTGDLHAEFGPQLRGRPAAARRSGQGTRPRPLRPPSRCDLERARRSLRPRRRARRRRFSRGCAPRHRTGRGPSRAAPACPWDRRCAAAAGCPAATVRSASTSTGASSQTVIARSLSSSRVRGSTNTPPPVAMTRTSPSTSRATSRRSPSRKSASPKRSNTSAAE